MSQGARRASELAAQVEAARADRDREAAGRREALAEVHRLRCEVVRLHARLQEIEAAELARAAPAGVRRRGLASLISAEPAEARGA